MYFIYVLCWSELVYITSLFIHQNTVVGPVCKLIPVPAGVFWDGVKHTDMNEKT